MASSYDGLKLVATAQGQNISTSSDGGISWVKQINSGSISWSSVACSSNGNIIIAAVIYTSSDSGLSWIAGNSFPLLMVGIRLLLVLAG